MMLKTLLPHMPALLLTSKMQTARRRMAALAALFWVFFFFLYLKISIFTKLKHKWKTAVYDIAFQLIGSEIFSRIAQTTAALTRLKPVWNDRNISLSFKI